MLGLLLALSTTVPVVVAERAQPVLAIAFGAADRVLLLEDDRVSLWRLGRRGLAAETERRLPAPAEAIRHPGGLIHPGPDRRDFWVLRSGWGEARLVRFEEGALGTVLIADETAPALAWTAAPRGLRFRPGTDLIDGELQGLGPGPHAAVSLDGSAVVDAFGRLRVAGALESSAGCVGSSFALPWPDLAIASAPTAGAGDRVLGISIAEELRLSVLADMPGAVRALAADVRDETAVLLVAVDEGERHRVFRLDLDRRHGAGVR